MSNDLALYAHFPWCVRKCPYCDFNSHPLRPDVDFSTYARALQQDWQEQRYVLNTQGLARAITSVFLGGGTPSLFGPDYLAPVLEQLILTEQAEVTLEANPGTTEHHRFKDYRSIGINRLSLGAQSFNDRQLTNLGRIHAARDTYRAFEQARHDGMDNINLDLMWGLPGQSVAEALDDLHCALALKSEHISWYQLTLEPKTEFYKRPPQLPVDSTLADIERHGHALLAEYGYQRYEVSAYARDGYRCRHNLNYWSFGDYLGIGAGAHGKLSQRHNSGLDVWRTTKVSQPRRYLDDPLPIARQNVDVPARPLEFMMNALRLVDGVAFDVFTDRTGLSWEYVAPTWQRLQDQGLVQADRCATTAFGLRFLDSVLAEFLRPD